MNEKMVRTKLSDADIARLNWQLLGTTAAQRADIIALWAAWIEADEIAHQLWDNASGYQAGQTQLQYALLKAERARDALNLERADEALRIERFVYGPEI